ncbi:MAG: hypothetical protein OXE17_05850 [Chloroflexi bacterium]|nr:hypothetical protein [Chloroflexota bacterium]
MSIIDIENRTENWKTVEAFTPMLSNEEARCRLAQKLLQNIHENLNCSTKEVKLELFWNGVRDYLHWKDEQGNSTSKKEKREDRHSTPLAKTYQELFASLRSDIDKSKSLTLRKEWNYQAFDEKSVKKLFHNLHGTEMDIVLDTPGYLLVGEAKDESRLGANSDLVLVHQLIRQYVTAKVLLHFSGNANKKVALFSVVKNRESFLRTYQAKFVLDKGWLCTANVLSWEDINRLAK